MHRQALLTQRLAHGVLELHAREQVGVHLWLVKAKAATPPLLDAVHGRVGLLDEIVQRDPVLRIQRHANAALDGEPHAIQQERPEHVVQYPACHAFRHHGVGAMQINHELVATEAAQHVGLSQASLQALGNQLQYPITKGMAQRVVDDLEPVQIQEKDGKAGVAGPPALNRGVHPLR